MSSFQLSLLALGGLVLLAVWGFNLWTSRRSRPRQAVEQSVEPDASVEEPVASEAPVEPVLEDDFSHLPLPERKPTLDPLIDVVASVEVDGVVSGDAALAAMPSTRRIGSKAFFAEGLSESSGQWDILLSTIVLTDDWNNWQESPEVEVLRAEFDWEGADAPIEPSVRSTAYGHVNQLRDPALFVEDGAVYLLYAVAGESGIAIASVTF